MELFELTKAMFESPAKYSEATKGDKRKNFFMIQRRMAINFPIQAQLLQDEIDSLRNELQFYRSM